MKIKVGLSSCLMGNNVRFDGGHKHSKMCSQNLARHFDFISEGPEFGIGMGTPRKPIRLIGDVNSPLTVSTQDNTIDHTKKMVEFSYQKAKEYSELPIEESGRLIASSLGENFITRVFAYHKWQQLKQVGFTYHGIIEFHSSYKYSLMAHSPASYIELGRMLADAGKHEVDELAECYFPLLMSALGKVATRKTHTNVLMHIQGYLKRVLSSIEKHELSKLINQYRLAQIPLIVPITLLKHHFSNHPHSYIAKQVYLEPYPDDLSLRNAI